MTNICCNFSAEETLSGIWLNVDGSELHLDSEGQFKAVDFPQKFFDIDSQSEGRIDGYGRWTLQRKFLSKELVLNYENYTGDTQYKGYRYIFHISNGNQPYLYSWIGEEGNEIFKLMKQ